MSAHPVVDLVITGVYAIIALFTALRIGFGGYHFVRAFLYYLVACAVFTLIFGIYRAVYFAYGAPFVFMACQAFLYWKFRPKKEDPVRVFVEASSRAGFHVKHHAPENPLVVSFPYMESANARLHCGYADFQTHRLVRIAQSFTPGTVAPSLIRTLLDAPPEGAHVERSSPQKFDHLLWTVLRNNSPKLETDGTYRLRTPVAESAEQQASVSVEVAGAKEAEEYAVEIDDGEELTLADLREGMARAFPYRSEAMFEEVRRRLDCFVKLGRMAKKGTGEELTYFNPNAPAEDDTEEGASVPAALGHVDCLDRMPAPMGLAGFSRGVPIDNEVSHPGLGWTIPYSSDGIKTTVYLYGLHQGPTDEGPESEVVRAHFDEVLQGVADAVKQGQYESATLRMRFISHSPERGKEFLGSEYRIVQGGRSMDSYVYLTGSRGKFVKIRVTAPADTGGAKRAHQFVTEYARLLWPEGKSPKTTAADTTAKPTDPPNGKHFEWVNAREGKLRVLGEWTVRVFGPYSWRATDIESPTCRGASCNAYRIDDTSGHDLASILVVDATDDAEEPNVGELTSSEVPVVDRTLRIAVERDLEAKGNKVTQWMSSQLNEVTSGKGLVTPYIVEEQDRMWQYIALRFRANNRNMVVIGGFDIEAKADLAAPVFNLIRTISARE